MCTGNLAPRCIAPLFRAHYCALLYQKLSWHGKDWIMEHTICHSLICFRQDRVLMAEMWCYYPEKTSKCWQMKDTYLDLSLNKLSGIYVIHVHVYLPCTAELNQTRIPSVCCGVTWSCDPWVGYTDGVKVSLFTHRDTADPEME